MQVAVCPIVMPEGEAVTETDEIEPPWPFTLTELEPAFFASWFEVATIVSRPDEGALAGAVYNPVLVIVPDVADQVTEVSKLPVPTTLAEHWLV